MAANIHNATFSTLSSRIRADVSAMRTEFGKSNKAETARDRERKQQQARYGKGARSPLTRADYEALETAALAFIDAVPPHLRNRVAVVMDNEEASFERFLFSWSYKHGCINCYMRGYHCGGPNPLHRQFKCTTCFEKCSGCSFTPADLRNSFGDSDRVVRRCYTRMVLQGYINPAVTPTPDGIVDHLALPNPDNLTNAQRVFSEEVRFGNYGWILIGGATNYPTICQGEVVPNEETDDEPDDYDAQGRRKVPRATVAAGAAPPAGGAPPPLPNIPANPAMQPYIGPPPGHGGFSPPPLQFDPPPLQFDPPQFSPSPPRIPSTSARQGTPFPARQKSTPPTSTSGPARIVKKALDAARRHFSPETEIHLTEAALNRRMNVELLEWKRDAELDVMADDTRISYFDSPEDEQRVELQASHDRNPEVVKDRKKDIKEWEKEKKRRKAAIACLKDALPKKQGENDEGSIGSASASKAVSRKGSMADVSMGGQSSVSRQDSIEELRDALDARDARKQDDAAYKNDKGDRRRLHKKSTFERVKRGVKKVGKGASDLLEAARPGKPRSSGSSNSSQGGASGSVGSAMHM